LEPIEIVARLGASQFPERLVAALSQVADEVRKLPPGAKGKVTVKFEIGRADNEIGVWITETYSVGLPPKEGMGAHFYALEGLHKSDPRQPVLLVREVDQETGEIRDVRLPEQQLRESEPRK
jgi:hypothetical protein